MRISELMTRKLITVAPDDTVEGAVRLLRQRGVRHLLVMNKGRLVGILSDRDLKRAMDPGKPKKKLLNLGGLFFLLEPILIREIMTSNPVTIDADASAQEAAEVMVAERFGALPVERNGETIGIVTETDLLRHFARTGAERAPEEKKANPRKRRS